MMKCVSVLVALLSATGLLELWSRSKFGMGLMELVSDRASQEEVGEHREEWDYHDRQHGFGHHQGFHAAMHEKMWKMKLCHRNCSTDGACHERCPRPWNVFEEKCARLQRISTCCAACGRNHACEMSCRDLAMKCGKFDKLMMCHKGCGGWSGGCHRKCPRLREVWGHRREHRPSGLPLYA